MKVFYTLLVWFCLVDVGWGFKFPMVDVDTGQTYTMTVEAVTGENAGTFWTGSAWSANATDLACTEKGGTNGVAEYELTTGITYANLGQNILVRALLHDSLGGLVSTGNWCFMCDTNMRGIYRGWKPTW